jgi:hypothetical protein
LNAGNGHHALPFDDDDHHGASLLYSELYQSALLLSRAMTSELTSDTHSPFEQSSLVNDAIHD